jgi:Cu/Ag efflux protein CusF
MLDQLKVGDRIRFVAEQVDGALTISSLEPVR